MGGNLHRPILFELEFWDAGFVEEGKHENQEKNPQTKPRTNSNLNPHMAPGQN